MQKHKRNIRGITIQVQWAVLSELPLLSVSGFVHFSLSTTCRFGFNTEKTAELPHVSVTAVTTRIYMYMYFHLSLLPLSMRRHICIWLLYTSGLSPTHLASFNTSVYTKYIHLNQMHVAFSSNTDFHLNPILQRLGNKLWLWFCSYLISLSSDDNGATWIVDWQLWLSLFQNALGVTFIAELMAEFSSEVLWNWASAVIWGRGKAKKSEPAVFSLLACFVCVVVFRELGKHQRKKQPRYL